MFQKLGRFVWERSGKKETRTSELAGCRAALLVANGLDERALLALDAALRSQGCETTIVAPAPGKVRGFSGDHWGRSTFTPGDRSGRKPLGVAFELVAGDKPDQRIPPQAGREIAAYYAAK